MTSSSAFADAAASYGYRNHEFGDSVLIQRMQEAEPRTRLLPSIQPPSHCRACYSALTTPMIGP